MELLASAFFSVLSVANADNVNYWKLIMVLLVAYKIVAYKECNINFRKWLTHSNGLLYWMEQVNK